MKYNKFMKDKMHRKLVIGILGMMIFSMGLNLIISFDMGSGPFDTMIFLMQEIFGIDSFGNTAFLLNLIFASFLLIFTIFSKSLKVTAILISVFSIFIMTRFINLFSFLANFNVENSLLTLIFFLLSFIFLYSFGLFLMIKSNILISPYDKFVVETSGVVKKEIGRTRVILDWSLLAISLVALIIFEIFIPISYVTVFITIFTGIFISLFSKYVKI